MARRDHRAGDPRLFYQILEGVCRVEAKIVAAVELNLEATSSVPTLNEADPLVLEVTEVPLEGQTADPIPM